MTFHNVAKRLSAEGRGPDSTLVHMSKGEVKSLQDIARAHGGSLSVNPNTGLPEAGFLSSILPVVAGAALMATGIGAPAAAMLVGGGTALATGDIRKGLSAGLGAYGGAGLGSSLAEMGASSLAGQSAAAAFDPTTLATAGQGAPASLSAMEPSTFFEPGQAAMAQPQTLGQSIADIKANTPYFDQLQAGLGQVTSSPGAAGSFLSKNIMPTIAAVSPMLSSMSATAPTAAPTTPANRLTYQANPLEIAPQASVYTNPGANFGVERRYFNPRFVDTGTPFKAGVYAGGGSIESFKEPGIPRTGEADTGDNTRFPMSSTPTSVYATAFQQPVAEKVLGGPDKVRIDPYTGEERLAAGGVSHLGDYSDGGRLLRGPGDGVSDSIPAVIGRKQPARLADGEFVVPARIVSELGNGSSEAGARKLYAMLDRVQNARRKSVGKGKVAVDSKAEKLLPA